LRIQQPAAKQKALEEAQAKEIKKQWEEQFLKK